VDLAREVADMGIPSFRFDLSGLGDSTMRAGDLSDEARAVVDIRETFDYLNKIKGYDRFILFGFCSGADNAHVVGKQDRRVVGAVMLDGPGYPNLQYHLYHYWVNLFKATSWKNKIKRLFKSGKPVKKWQDIYVRTFGPREQVEAEIKNMANRGIELLYIYTGGISYFNHASQFMENFPSLRVNAPDSTIHYEYYGSADHTYSNLEDRAEMFSRVLRWLQERFLRESAIKTAMKKNILMLCYYYPPLSDVGCKRSVALSKYLKKHGWNPYVLSVKNPDRFYCSVGTASPPQGVHTKYSRSIINPYRIVGRMNGLLSRLLKLFGIKYEGNYLYQLFCFPDHFWGWIPLTTLRGLGLIRKHGLDLIYVSCTPFSATLIGALLKRMTKKPLILDFRDPFATKSVFDKMTNTFAFRKKLLKNIERRVIGSADIFIVTSRETMQEYIEQYPEVQDKIFTIHNGIDAENMAIPCEKIVKYDKFTVVFTGHYIFWANLSNIFFEALAILKSTGQIDKNYFQFLFFGDSKDEICRIAESYAVEDLVTASSRIPYQDVLTVILKSHLQLLRVMKPLIPVKLLEGIPMNVPFLAPIPPGEAEEMIRKYSPSSFIITEESPQKVADAIVDAMTRYKNNEIHDNHVQEFLENFSREHLNLKLMNIIEQNLRAKGYTFEDN